MIRNGDKVQVQRNGTTRTGTAVSDITYRTNAGRSRKQVKVHLDGETAAWNILLTYVTPAA